MSFRDKGVVCFLRLDYLVKRFLSNAFPGGWNGGFSQQSDPFCAIGASFTANVLDFHRLCSAVAFAVMCSSSMCVHD